MQRHFELKFGKEIPGCICLKTRLFTKGYPDIEKVFRALKMLRKNIFNKITLKEYRKCDNMLNLKLFRKTIARSHLGVGMPS